MLVQQRLRRRCVQNASEGDPSLAKKTQTLSSAKTLLLFSPATRDQPASNIRPRPHHRQHIRCRRVQQGDAGPVLFYNRSVVASFVLYLAAQCRGHEALCHAHICTQYTKNPFHVSANRPSVIQRSYSTAHVSFGGCGSACIEAYASCLLGSASCFVPTSICLSQTRTASIHVIVPDDPR